MYATLQEGQQGLLTISALRAANETQARCKSIPQEDVVNLHVFSMLQSHSIEDVGNYSMHVYANAGKHYR